uniref:30S ribosomal protein S2 n=1 Tax=Treponema sp. TaxID=166 RepID=UPI00388CF909
HKLGIPVIAIVDTNCNPEEVDFPIPGNDDAIRAISLFTSIIANAVVEANNEEGLKIIETLGDEDDVVTDASTKKDDEEIVDYSNYTPTEEDIKKDDVSDDDDDDITDVDESKIK